MIDRNKKHKLIAQKIAACAALHAREVCEPSRADLRAMLEEAARNTAKMQEQREQQRS
jgi:hypothetical protein